MRKKIKAKQVVGGSQQVRLELNRPQTHEVFVAGSFNDWQPTATPLKPAGEGKWGVELSLPPGRYEYRFIADGEWIDDPNAKEFVPNPHGGANAVLIVPSA